MCQIKNLNNITKQSELSQTVFAILISDPKR